MEQPNTFLMNASLALSEKKLISCALHDWEEPYMEACVDVDGNNTGLVEEGTHPCCRGREVVARREKVRLHGDALRLESLHSGQSWERNMAAGAT